MQVFKFFILISIWAISSYIGIIFSKKYSNRAQNLKEFKSILNILETKIKFTYEPLPEIFEQIAKSSSKSIAEVFYKTKEKMNINSTEEAWKYGIEGSTLDLKNEDIAILNGLGKMLR